MKYTVNAVTIEIVRNFLLSIAEEMGVALVKSAYSTNIKERRDISTAVFDPEGNMVAQAEHVPMHLGSLLGIISEILKKYNPEDIHPGDMFIGNDPYNGGGTHLPDITIAAPVFVDNKLIGWVANLAHHSDVGGKVPGSTSGDAISIFQEGIIIPLMKLSKKNEVNDDIIRFIMTNSRIPNERYGDLQAQIAANRIGINRLTDAYTRYDKTLVDCMYELQDYAERRLRAKISDLENGEYSFEDFMDDAGVSYPDPIKINVKIKINGDSMAFDFSGTNEQVPGPINVTFNGLLATVFYSVKALIGPDIPSNAGIYRVLDVKAAPGLIINAQHPAPVGARIDTCMRVADVVFGALAKAVPERAIAGCNSSCTTAVFSGTNPSNKDHYYVYLETIAGGAGASRHTDGLDGVQVHLTNTSNLPVEALEMEFPLITVREYSLITDSGGAGKYRGGQGICREYEACFDDITYTGLGDRQVFKPWGLDGGKNGAGGAYYLTHANGESERLASKCSEIKLNKGDVLRVLTPGAGGYGDPDERSPESVFSDFLEGKVSIEKAKELYGVSIVKDGNSYSYSKI